MIRYLIPIVILWSQKSSACTCVRLGKEDIKRHVQFVNYIAHCRVVSCDTVTFRDTVLSEGGEPWYLNYTVLRYSVKALEVFKDTHQAKGDIVTIFTMAGKNECSANFQIGKEYLVFANWQNKLADVQPEKPEFLFTSSCEPNSLNTRNGVRNIRRTLRGYRRPKG